MSHSLPLRAASAAWLLAGVEFFFSIGWVVYVIFLPALLARAGVDPRHLPRLLLADQLLFALADWSLGVAIDRSRAALRRIGPLLVGLSTISAVSLCLLPSLAETPPLFLLLTGVWVASSSALRAPPYVLLSRYAARAAMPRLAGIQLLGLAAASALAPYLAILLKGVDPLLPFASSALAVGLAATSLLFVERAKPVPAPAADSPPAGSLASPAALPAVPLLLGALLLAFGQQVHTAVNSAAQLRRLAGAELLPWLMPVFWIGFSFALLAVDRLIRRYGAAAILRGAGVSGVLALGVAAAAPSLALLVIDQVVAGAAWGLILCASIGVAVERGQPLQVGRHSGALMATLAVAALSRIGLGVSGGGAAIGQWLDWLPAAAWAAALVVLGTSSSARSGH